MKFLTGAVFFVISFSCFSNSLSFNDFPSKSVSSAYVNKLIAGSGDYSELYIKDANRSLLEGKLTLMGIMLSLSLRVEVDVSMEE